MEARGLKCAPCLSTAYKIRVEDIADDLSTDSYSMRVQEVIKGGSLDAAPLDKLRIFISYQHCREALGLQKGKTYLVMGSSKDVHTDDQRQTFQYVLGERTWVEYWPTTAECLLDEYRPTCLGLQKMVNQYITFAC